MSDTLYSALMLERVRQPRHRGLPAGMNRHGSAVNRLCGDAIEIGCVMEADRVRALGFTAEGCAILIGSADLMVDALIGQGADRIGLLDAAFDRLLNSGEADPALPEPLQALAPLAAYPSRRTCASLPWQAMRAALGGEGGRAP